MTRASDSVPALTKNSDQGTVGGVFRFGTLFGSGLGVTRASDPVASFAVLGCHAVCCLFDVSPHWHG